MQFDQATTQMLFQYALRLGDDRLVLGHRLSEWCGHAPILEEDIALANIALDLLGQAQAWLRLAGQLEGKGRNEDDLAYFREAVQFCNLQLVEQPRGDFAFTIARQFIFDLYSYELMQKLQTSALTEFAALAAKCVKEHRYHLRHAREWVLRLGDGTVESHERMQRAFNELWMFIAELFEADATVLSLTERNLIPDGVALKASWQKTVEEVLAQATLSVPDSNIYMTCNSRSGKHSEHLGHMLAEMQILARSFPGASW